MLVDPTDGSEEREASDRQRILPYGSRKTSARRDQHILGQVSVVLTERARSYAFANVTHVRALAEQISAPISQPDVRRDPDARTRPAA